MKLVTLRELCIVCGVSRRAVQGYEKHGLLKPAGKNSRGHLLYGDDEVSKVKRIKLMQDFGFQVREIADVIGMDPSEAAQAFAEKKKMKESEREKLDRTIRLLDEMIKQAKKE